MTRFCGFDFKTTEDTFIPRPETELLVEVCLGALLSLRGAHILDIGTGSGNIAISLTKKNRDCKIVALDKSEAALIAAKENARSFGVSSRIRFIRSDIFKGLGRRYHKNFDIIVSNPPYIPDWEIPTLADNVRKEPLAALDGGADGLDYYKRIIDEAADFLKDGGHLIMEMGYNQSFRIKKLLKEARFIDMEIFKDFSDIDRVIKAKWTSS